MFFGAISISPTLLLLLLLLMGGRQMPENIAINQEAQQFVKPFPFSFSSSFFFCLPTPRPPCLKSKSYSNDIYFAFTTFLSFFGPRDKRPCPYYLKCTDNGCPPMMDAIQPDLVLHVFPRLFPLWLLGAWIAAVWQPNPLNNQPPFYTVVLYYCTVAVQWTYWEMIYISSSRTAVWFPTIVPIAIVWQKL